jgi:hypothetical protein
MSREERRNHPRFRPKPGCHIVYVEGSGEVKDLSLDGLFILDQDPLSVGTSVKFSLRQGAQEILLQGTVIRSEPQHGMAIQFKDISREAIRQLKIYIAGLGPESETPPRLQLVHSSRQNSR